MLLGLFFIVSAVAKVVDMDRFEVYIFSYNILSLNLSFLVARLVVVAELLVGIALMANIFKRLTDIAALLMLVAFTMFLGYAALAGREDPCHCMGALVEINPVQSMLKNALLILLLLFAMGAAPWKRNPRWFVWLPLAVAPIVAVFCISAPDNWLFPAAEEVFNEEEFSTSIASGGDLYGLGLDKGNHVLAFLTPGCQFCKMADEKLTHICRRNNLDSADFVNLVPTTDSTIAPLTPDTSTFLRTSYLIPSMTFALITYGQRPMVFLLEEGRVVGTCHYRNIDERRIVELLEE